MDQAIVASHSKMKIGKCLNYSSLKIMKYEICFHFKTHRCSVGFGTQRSLQLIHIKSKDSYTYFHINRVPSYQSQNVDSSYHTCGRMDRGILKFTEKSFVVVFNKDKE